MAFFGPPDLFAQADEVHIDVTFTYDKNKAESLAEDWKHVAPVHVEMESLLRQSGAKVSFRACTRKRGYTFTSCGLSSAVLVLLGVEARSCAQITTHRRRMEYP